ncbi:MAG: hypothetical protein K2H67_04325 [Treponemataceae bacterium]|nr:hypothetical protein [Treponemataceae bacterium]
MIYLGRYFEFYAAQNSNAGNSEFRFLGTYVYYRIYSSSSTMISNHNSIEAVNNSSNYSAAAERMIGLGYRELNTDKGILSPFAAGTRVHIRLTNYKEKDSGEIGNKAQIIEIDNNGTVIAIDGFPRRSRGNSYSFDFGRYINDTYKEPGIITIPRQVTMTIFREVRRTTINTMSICMLWRLAATRLSENITAT